MCRKKTIEEVREYVESQGYELLSEDYKNSYTKLKLKCPEGHEYETCWDSLQQGGKCCICNKIKSHRTKKSIKEIKIFVESQGYKLLSEYYNHKEKIKFECPRHHEYFAMWGNFQDGQRCPICCGNRRKTIEEVREYVERQGYELLSDEYENANTKLKIKCSEKHEFLVSWSNFHGVNGSRCSKCSNKLKSIKMRTSIKFVEEYVKKQGYILLSTKYENSGSRLKFKCPKGHEYITSWNSFYYAKGRCPKCAKLRNPILFKCGLENPAWKDGSSFEPYPIIFNGKLKREIKERDGYICINPICFRKHSVLHVHHINYNKENCKKENLITICNSCNSRANTNRNWWTNFYQNILHEKYGYIYENIEKDNYKCLEIQ